MLRIPRENRLHQSPSVLYSLPPLQIALEFVTFCYFLLLFVTFCYFLLLLVTSCYLLLLFVTFRYLLLSFVTYFLIFQDVHMVRLEDQNGEYADKYELDVVPCLVLFHEKRPRVFKGQISDEKEAIKWFREIVASFED